MKDLLINQLLCYTTSCFIGYIILPLQYKLHHDLHKEQSKTLRCNFHLKEAFLEKYHSRNDSESDLYK